MNQPGGQRREERLEPQAVRQNKLRRPARRPARQVAQSHLSPPARDPGEDPGEILIAGRLQEMGVEPCLARSSTVLLLAVGRQRHEEHPVPSAAQMRRPTSWPSMPGSLMSMNAISGAVARRSDGLEAVDGDEVGSLALDALGSSAAAPSQRHARRRPGLSWRLWTSTRAPTSFCSWRYPHFRVSVMSFFVNASY